MPHRPAPRQAPIGSARPHSPRPEQQEPEHEGPRFRREEGGAHARADTHARKRMRGCACADARTARSLRKLGISAAAPEEEGGLGTGLPLAVTSAAAAGQAPIGSARPHSPHPVQQEPQPEGPRLRREKEGRARTHGRMRQRGRQKLPGAWEAGCSCSGSLGRRRSGDWAAAGRRLRCRRRAGNGAPLLPGFGEANAAPGGGRAPEGPGSTSDGPQVMACSREAGALLSRSCGRKGVARANSWICYDPSRPWGGLCYPMFAGCTLAVSRRGFVVRVRGRWRRAAADGGLRRQRAAAAAGGELRRRPAATAGCGGGRQLRRLGEGVPLGASQVARIYPVCSGGGLSCRRFPGLGVLGMETRPQGQRAPIVSAWPDSPHPGQQVPQPEGPRLPLQEEGRARTRRCPCAYSRAAQSVGKWVFLRGSRGGTRPEVWVATCRRRRCRRRAHKGALVRARSSRTGG
ncbi:translation initiation factor IF-2-like [Camelus ferus]|uniref:Translation initiation factor IF-2-like n=1 Tax=Camelus ferus TaxID=419612 RepID=A0A8B8RK89_CAMFR|nr:translation initiation factor IF-2-like [Camelus ferus]